MAVKKKPVAKKAADKKPVGRKSKLKSVEADLIKYVTAGLTFKSATGAVGIDESTFYLWLQKGEEDIRCEKTTDYSEFFKSIKKAENEHKLKRLRIIRLAASNPSNWQAAAWELERRYRDEYGKQALDLQLSGKAGGEPIETKSTVQVYIPDNGRDKN